MRILFTAVTLLFSAASGWAECFADLNNRLVCTRQQYNSFGYTSPPASNPFPNLHGPNIDVNLSSRAASASIEAGRQLPNKTTSVANAITSVLESFNRQKEANLQRQIQEQQLEQLRLSNEQLRRESSSESQYQGSNGYEKKNSKSISKVEFDRLEEEWQQAVRRFKSIP